jgi:hypothetical protein
MFCVSEAQAAVIRTAFEQRGELSAVVELRRLFSGLGNIAWAQECVRTIAGWQAPLTQPSIMPRLVERRLAPENAAQATQIATARKSTAD